jgi:hypothetical protein
MSRLSYTAEGFRAAWRRPALTLAEITWRWAVGATSAVLAVFALFQYLSMLPVTNGELLFLRTRQPVLVGQVLEHILRGSLNRAVVAGIVGLLALCALWIFAASVGRLATLRELREYFDERKATLLASTDGSALPASQEAIAEPNVEVRPRQADAFTILVRLNFLRAAATLAAILSLIGAGILAGFASPAADPQPALAFFLFLPLAALVACIWSSLNWLLSLAAIFALRDREDAIGAVSAAVNFFRQHPGPVFAVGTWTGLAHLVAWVGASSVISAPLGFAPILPWRLVVAGMIVLSLAYFVVADWLYVARLAGYVCITEMPEGLMNPAPLPPTPQSPAPFVPPPVPPKTSIDRDEPILSDLPILTADGGLSV